MSVLFIADLHLSTERPTLSRAFFHFLQQSAASASALYILGDLFEAWIGDDDPSDLSLQVQRQLKHLTDCGVTVFIQRGNRDFLLGRAFIAATGATLLADEHIVEYAGQRALIMHGDSLCTDDLDYQRFRRRAHNPLYQWYLRLLPLRRRQRLAAEWRAKSIAANSNKPSQIMDVNPDAVESVMRQYNVEVLIHGHTHRPDRHTVRCGERIVLGDWHKQGWVLRLDKEGYALQSFAIDCA